MTVADFVAETVGRYRHDPVKEATKDTALAAYRGVVRRSLDHMIGNVWWQRSDWDILVIMDATRVDLAREQLDVPVRSAWSPASTSIDWIERHFDEYHQPHWSNAGYVTANPFADHDAESARSADLAVKDLGAFVPVYKNHWQQDPVGTTPPEYVTEAAVDVWNSEDVDRLIVHYMQPHQPFRSRPEWEHVYSNLENLATEVNQGGPDIWKRVRDGELRRADVWAAYADNLHWVWNEIHNHLIPNVNGRVLITADHGNGLGEFGSWSHAGGDLNPHVRAVPVMGPFIEAVDVKGTDDSRFADTTGENDVEEQLSALGYR